VPSPSNAISTPISPARAVPVPGQYRGFVRRRRGGAVAGKGSEPRRSVTSKVVAIIRSFGSGRSLTITEVAHAAKLPLSTTHRLVHELAAGGILDRGDDARYEIVLPSVSCRCRECPPGLRTVAAPVIEDLSAATKSD